MDENTTVVESVESQEVAEPDVESVEMEEAAELPTKSDAAFAEMRRRAESAEREIEALKKSNSDMSNALGYYFDGETSEKKVAQAIAHYQDRSLEDVEKELAERKENDTIRSENSRLRSELSEFRALKSMEDDLRLVQAIDPSVKSLEELGEDFLDLRLGVPDENGVRHGTNLSMEDIFTVLKARTERTRLKPPEKIGKVNESSPEQNDFSKEEVEAHKEDKAWIKKNLDKILASQSKW